MISLRRSEYTLTGGREDKLWAYQNVTEDPFSHPSRACLKEKVKGWWHEEWEWNFSDQRVQERALDWPKRAEIRLLSHRSSLPGKERDWSMTESQVMNSARRREEGTNLGLTERINELTSFLLVELLWNERREEWIPSRRMWKFLTTGVTIFVLTKNSP